MIFQRTARIAGEAPAPWAGAPHNARPYRSPATSLAPSGNRRGATDGPTDNRGPAGHSPAPRRRRTAIDRQRLTSPSPSPVQESRRPRRARRGPRPRGDRCRGRLSPPQRGGWSRRTRKGPPANPMVVDVPRPSMGLQRSERPRVRPSSRSLPPHASIALAVRWP